MTIITGTGGAVGVVFADKSTMGLGGDARMVIDQMVFDPATQTGVQAFSLVQGAFVIASGAIGKFDPESVSVRTPVATIGIRRSEEHTSELQSLMRTSYAVFCLKKKHNTIN